MSWLKIILIFLFLIALGFAGYFVYQYYQSLQANIQQQELIKTQLTYHAPRLHIESLSEGKVGEKYQTEILASYTGSHEELTINLKNPPQGFTLGECKKEFDIPILEKPNTFTSCTLFGVPTEAKEYNLEFTASVRGPLGFIRTSKNAILTIIK
jgi:hypothetical protein